jgi:hypothetical protein
MLDTARAIESGAPSLATLRPDLPKALLQLVDRSLSLAPSRRPSAQELAAHLRGAAAPRRKKRTRSGGFAVALPEQAGRAAAAALAAGFAGWTAASLPFFPHGWALGLAVLAAAVTGLRERLGLAVALAVPILPLGNVSLGLGVAYAALALAWLVLSWREPRSGLLFALGPLLAPIAALGLLPLAACGVRSPVRRAAQVAAGVLVAAVVAGIRHGALPFAGGPSPLGVGVAGASDPFDVVGSVVRAAGAHPTLLFESVALAVLAAALPYARARGRWGAAALGAAMVVLTVPAVPTAAVAPLVVAAWLTAAALAVRAGTA